MDQIFAHMICHQLLYNSCTVSKFSNFDKDYNWATNWWLRLKSTALVQSNKKYFQLETKQQTFYLLGQKMASVKLTWQNCCYCPTGELMKRKVENTHREHGPMQRDVSNQGNLPVCYRWQPPNHITWMNLYCVLGFLGQKLSLFSFSERGCGSKLIHWKWSTLGYEQEQMPAFLRREGFSHRVEMNCLWQHISRCSFTASGDRHMITLLIHLLNTCGQT